MAKSTSKTSTRSKKTKQALMGWKLKSFLKDSAATAKLKKFDGTVYYLGDADAFKAISEDIKDEVGPFQAKTLSSKKTVQKLVTDDGIIWVVIPQVGDQGINSRNRGRLAPSPYSRARELMGSVLGDIESSAVKQVKIVGEHCSDDEKRGLLVGAELAAYTFRKALGNQSSDLKIYWDGFSKALVDEAANLGVGTNLARHLVNVPPNELYPESYSQTVKDLFDGLAGVKVTVWDENKLARENMGLIQAVGNAAQHKPRLVHIRYRPRGASKQKPLVFVGKGITFDSGGLDIKPAMGMRYMKKDMGGSAALVGMFYGLVHNNLKKAIDIYLPMAENAIAGNAFRPGDIYTARSGKTVEIHNTDAEGRLILADALSLAAEQSGDHKAQSIINVATLTGAVKVGLGVGMGGFFSNDDALVEKIEESSQGSGDLMWEMPLFDDYKSQLKSSVADINHCSTSGFGGAVTAALFLHAFVEEASFAHFDIYSWMDRPKGALRESGGSGQGVQCLYQLVQSY
ncbi:M17 family metallopeptidase [Pseudobacteriovorax antillogorgiicola]|uniref:Leucyl aminopeptidase n=1 Tax=Pseudobacteriovorax antillogorgiicola TaxID=1513793 RepID=A0A1Y6CK48_9BACT|nr:leucyl aminopeptidase family protein [Pseudobacteriovorax antillogorgiicola]TCS45845.1 leucyl aminopeptidase [Pseudobacteriovorax antillogorgiicola]SMF71809.1 leucyl aminopeptidase [Pseudobacteriovorax antillogorgiicola]